MCERMEGGGRVSQMELTGWTGGKGAGMTSSSSSWLSSSSSIQTRWQAARLSII